MCWVSPEQVDLVPSTEQPNSDTLRGMMLTILLSSLASAACPTFAEPAGEWADRRPEVSETAAIAIREMETFLFPRNIDEEERRGVRTDGLVIVRDGAVLYERYGRDWEAYQPHLQWSASKSVSAALVGIAVQQGLLNVDASICDVISVGDPASCAVTVRNLMEFSSGFAWRETYEGQSPTTSSVVGMLYGAGKADMATFVTGHPLRDTPGTTYAYSSGDTVVQTAVAHAVLSQKFGPDYLQTQLFGPLGITSAAFERDLTGVPIGSSTLYLTPRDMARFGAFLLQDGCWGGERLLPEGWMARATTPASSLNGRSMDAPTGSNPGWNLWLNQPHPSRNEGAKPWPDVPEDAFAALGHWRQGVYVLPSERLVVAYTGDDRDGALSRNDLLKHVLNVVHSLPDTDSPAPSFTPAGFSPVAMGAVAEAPGAVPPEAYDVGLLHIGTSYAALQACACRWVSDRTQEACRSYIRIQPDIARVKFDEVRKVTIARAFGMARTEARWVDEQQGCMLEGISGE